MNRKSKLFFSLVSLCFSIAVLCFGVYSALSVSYSISGSVSYEINDVFVELDLSVYRALSTTPVNSATHNQNVSTIKDALDNTIPSGESGFSQLTQPQYSDHESTYEKGEVKPGNEDGIFEADSENLALTYGSPTNDNQGYAFYIVIDIHNLGSEIINAQITAPTSLENTILRDSGNVEITANGTERIVLGLALDDVTTGITSAGFTYTITISRGELPEAEPITDMTFSLDEATTTATLTSYTGSGGIVKIPETVGIGKQKTKDFGPYANVNELINEFSSSEKGLLDVYLIGDISYTSENEQKVDENQMIAFWAMNNENAEYANIEIKCKDRHTLKVSASDMENDVGVVRLYGPAAGYLVVGDQTILDTMSMSYTIRLNNEEFYIDKNAVMQSIENNPGVFADYIDLIGSLIEGGTQEIMVTFEDIVYGETVTSGTEYIVTSIGSNVFQGFDYSDFEELITNVISSSYSMRSYNNIYSLSIPSTITSIASDAFVGTLPLVELFNYSNLDVVSYLVSEPDYVYTSSDIDGDTAPQSKVIILDNVYYLQNDDGLTALGLVDPYITEVHLNSRTTTINQGAFMGCNMIQDFYIPKTVTTVEDYGLFCFIRRPHIESISTWATMNFAMPEYSFNRFPAIAILWIALVGQNPNEIEYIDDLAENLIIDLYYNSSPLSGDLVFEENIQYIRPLAFWGCMSLTSVTIPSSVTSIGADAFSSCYALAEVYNYSTHIGDVTIGSSTNGLLGQYAKVVYNPSDLTGGKPGTRIKTINNVQYYKDGEDFIALAPSVARGSLTTLTLDSSTTEINSHAFYNYSNLTSIEIPSSVTSIGDSAFYNCSALETVTFKDTTTEWTVTRDSTSKTITSQELQSPNTMATYLRSDYYNYTWTKKQSA